MANQTNVLAQGIEIIGTIQFQNDMIIDGMVEGEIRSEKGKVTIGENAKIKGDVRAGDVKMFGQVEGSIHSTRCELKANSKLLGDITTKSLKMEEGALLSGKMQTGS
jgi:cytoskeletal protein CcmA (bactofilin family)